MFEQIDKDLIDSLMRLDMPTDFIVMVSEGIFSEEKPDLIQYLEKEKPTIQEIIKKLNEIRNLPEDTIWHTMNFKAYGTDPDVIYADNVQPYQSGYFIASTGRNLYYYYYYGDGNPNHYKVKTITTDDSKSVEDYVNANR